MRPSRGVATALVLALLAVARAASAGDGGPPSPAPLAVVAPRWDAGRVEAGTPLRHSWELRNRGARTLQIAVKATCDCTTTDSDREIPAGAAGHVIAVVDTTHLRGRFEKVVDVTTNDPAQPMIPLVIVGESQRALIVEPGDMPTLRGPIHAVKALDLTVHAADGNPFRITEIRDDPSVRSTVVALDDGEPRGHRRYRLTLTPSPDLAVGMHRVDVALLTTAPQAERFVLPTTIVVTGPLVVMPPQLRLGRAHPSASARITAVDGSAFRVLGAVASDPDVTANVAPTPDRSAWDVTVRYAGAPLHHGPLNAVLTVRTDQPLQPTVAIRMSGRR